MKPISDLVDALQNKLCVTLKQLDWTDKDMDKFIYIIRCVTNNINGSRTRKEKREKGNEK